MFRGVLGVNMDAKGRIAMPTKHRDALNMSDAGCLVATIDIQSPCLLIYPLSTWLGIEKTLQELPTFDKRVRRMQRLMLGNASDLEMDASGRVLLPANLREYAGLSKKSVLVGQGKNFELWCEQRWREETEAAIAQVNDDDFEMPEGLQGLVL